MNVGRGVVFEVEVDRPDVLSVDVYDVGGRLVDHVERRVARGHNEFAWGDEPVQSKKLPSGVYLYSGRLSVADRRIGSGKVVLVR